MKETLTDRLKHAWNAFLSNDRETLVYKDYGAGYANRPDRKRFHYGHERSIIAAVYNRIAIDVASINVQHARLDENGRYFETIHSGLHYCLNTEANIDQTGRALMEDIVLSMCDEGCVAVVPVETDLNPKVSGGYDITSIRTGKITQWYPEHVRIDLYNDKKGRHEEIVMPKKAVAIIENPLYSIMNEPNSTLQRLIRKLNILDAIDEQSGAGKLDLIIQLPYLIKTDARKEQAEQRRKAIETQLADSKYGIAYTDGTEKVTQLNRSIDNNLMKQIEYLTSMLYSQLGLAQTIFDGTADEATMLNYHNRTIEPMISAIVDEMNRKFLTKTARSRNQKLVFFKDPFRLCPISNIATIADSFTRNEILSPNEVRQIIGMKPSDDETSNELRNRNMPLEETGYAEEEPSAENQNGGESTNSYGIPNGTPLNQIPYSAIASKGVKE